MFFLLGGNVLRVKKIELVQKFASYFYFLSILCYASLINSFMRQSKEKIELSILTEPAINLNLKQSEILKIFVDNGDYSRESD